MKRDKWREIIKKEYKTQNAYLKPGIASLITMKEVSEVVKFKYLDGTEFICCDENYHWLQIAYKDTPYWITAFYDDSNHLIQIYIDIIAYTDFTDLNNPCMKDLYLDVVIDIQDQISYHILDEDELLEALNKNDITKEEFDFASQSCKELCDYLDNHLNDFIYDVNIEYHQFQLLQ